MNLVKRLMIKSIKTKVTTLKPWTTKTKLLQNCVKNYPYDVIKWEEKWERNSLKKRWIIPHFLTQFCSSLVFVPWTITHIVHLIERVVGSNPDQSQEYTKANFPMKMTKFKDYALVQNRCKSFPWLFRQSSFQ